MITVITIEGVLSRGDDLKTAQPTKNAKALYDGFRSQNNMLGLTRADPEIVRWWLKREHLDDWATLLSYPDTSAFTYEHWRLDQIRGFLSEGWELFAYVDTHLGVVDEARAMGVAGICVSYPVTAPGWKETSPPRAWANVVTSTDNAAPWG